MAEPRRLPRSQLGRIRSRQRKPRLSAVPGHRDQVLSQRQRGPTTHSRQRDQGCRALVADHARSRQRDRRLAAQHRHPAHRQQDDRPRRARHHRGVRRVRRRPPPDAPDLPMARLQVRGLRRLRPHQRREQHRWIQEPLPAGREPSRRHIRCRSVCEHRRAQGRAAFQLAQRRQQRDRLRGERLLFPAQGSVRRRRAISERAAGADRQVPVRRRSVGPQRVRRLEPEGWPAVGGRPHLAGLRQYLAQRRGAEFRREQLRICFRVRRKAANGDNL